MNPDRSELLRLIDIGLSFIFLSPIFPSVYYTEADMCIIGLVLWHINHLINAKFCFYLYIKHMIRVFNWPPTKQVVLVFFIVGSHAQIETHVWLFKKKFFVRSAFPTMAGVVRRQAINLARQSRYCLEGRSFRTKQTAQYHPPEMSPNEGVGGLWGG